MPVQTVRLLYMEEVPFLRAQTIYHSVANTMRDGSPDSIILLSPRQPYVCAGREQDLEQEIDLDYCRSQHLPVLRRKLSGGTLYLDNRQLLFQCVFHKDRVPQSAEDLFRLFLQPVVETYKRLGLDARFTPPSDIVVGSKKIAGAGMACIGDAAVVAGTMVFDFDRATMARLLRAPSPAFRKLVHRQLRNYMTSVKDELGSEPDREEVRDILTGEFARALGCELLSGELSAEEWTEVEKLDRRFLTQGWLYSTRRPPSQVRQVKIRAGVMVYESSYTSQGNSARVTLSVADGRIDEVVLDGHLDPAERSRLEGSLLGRQVKTSARDEVLNLPALEAGGPDLEKFRPCLASIGKAMGTTA